jgi:hypothetical protein
MEQNPEEYFPSEPQSHINEARRRRRRKLLVPSGRSERTLYVNEIAKRLIPGVDFFLFSMLCGLVLGAAILLDNPAIFILAALIAPFMAPVVGLGFSAAVGSITFFLQSIGGLLIGSVFVFAGGALGGWLSKMFTTLNLTQARFHTSFSIPDFILLTIGACLAIYLTVRVPKSRSLVASVALAYEIYVPIAVAGFGLTSGIAGFFGGALKLAAVNIAWVLLIGTIVLAILRLRPFTFFGYLLTAVMLGAAVYLVVVSSALGTAVQKQLDPFNTKVPTPSSNLVVPTITLTPEPPTPFVQVVPSETTPTNTLVPTRTPTVTITPKPTPVWAKVFSSSSTGVVVRKAAGFSGGYLTSLLNDSPVQVLPDTVFLDGQYWSHIILEDGREGWIVRSLLLTATPVPNW